MSVIQNTKVSYGRQITPSGVEYTGIKVTIGQVLDPSTVERTYEDIEKAFGKKTFKISEEVRPDGKFKSYTVETG